MRFFVFLYDYNNKSTWKDWVMNVKKIVKLLTLALFAAMLLSVFGCASEPAEEPTQLSCVIEKIYDRALYVRAESDRYFFVNTNDIDTDSFRIGDEIEILFDGELAYETPGEIQNVYTIVLKASANSEKNSENAP